MTLHIDELVLHGFSEADAPLIKVAIERELTRLFTAQGVPGSLPTMGEVGRLNGGSFRVVNAGAEAIGGQIAQSIMTSFQP